MAMYPESFRKPPEHRVDLSGLKSNNPGAIVRAATEWTSKSASAFSDAIDQSHTPSYLHHHPRLSPVYRALRRAHAFDRGNQKYIDLMEAERKKIARQMSRQHSWFEDEYKLAPLEGNLDSQKSFFIQASDIAAGIAKHLFEVGGIFSVTMSFEYVMFNGKRMSQNEAYETMKKWQELGYFN